MVVVSKQKITELLVHRPGIRALFDVRIIFQTGIVSMANAGISQEYTLIEISGEKKKNVEKKRRLFTTLDGNTRTD